MSCLAFARCRAEAFGRPYVEKCERGDGAVHVRATFRSDKGRPMTDITPSRPAARRLPREQRVATILQTALAVLRERGSEQFLTAEVAERCGISEGTIYKYFATRRDLLIQVAEKWFEEFLTVERPPSHQRPVRDRLLHVIGNALALIRREPTITRFRTDGTARRSHLSHDADLRPEPADRRASGGCGRGRCKNVVFCAATFR